MRSTRTRVSDDIWLAWLAGSVLHEVVATKMTVRIRSYCVEDANAINRIALAAWDQYRTAFSDWPRTASFLAGTASTANELELLIAEDETEIRGFVGYVAPGRPR